MIEVKGLVNAIIISDQCLKASNVNLLGIENISSGLVTVKIVGDVGSITSAVQSIESINGIISSSIIPSLDNEVFKLFAEDKNNVFKKNNMKTENISPIQFEQNTFLEDTEEEQDIENLSNENSNLNEINNEILLQDKSNEVEENNSLQFDNLQSYDDDLEQKNVKQLREMLLKMSKTTYKDIKKLKKDEIISNIRECLKGE